MVVVDSSVWIDWIRDRETAGTSKLAACNPNEILVGDIVLLEVLRGARDERHARGLEARLREYEMAYAGHALATRAAANYRRLRSLGITARTVSDLIIGTFCFERSHVLLAKDRDFATTMAQHLAQAACRPTLQPAPQRRHLDLDLHLRLGQAADDHRRGGRDVAEGLAEDRIDAVHVWAGR